MDSNIMSILGTLMSEIADVKAVVTGHSHKLDDLSYQVAQHNDKFEELKKTAMRKPQAWFARQ